MKYSFKYILAALALLAVSCKKGYLDVEPTGVVSNSQFDALIASSADGVKKAVEPTITGIYAYMFQFQTYPSSGRHDDFGQKAVELGWDLMGTDMVQVKHHWFGFDYLNNSRQASSSRPRMVWNFYYKLISNANTIIAYIPTDTKDPDLMGYLGQAYAIRGMAYYYLSLAFQHGYKGYESDPCIPIYKSLEEAQAGKPRATVAEVYKLIEEDLLKAHGLLEGFERDVKTQIDQAVASGLLARMYLVTENWESAAKYAQEVVDAGQLMTADQYLDGFGDINNPEWLWGSDVSSETTTIFASFFSQVSSIDPGYAGALGVYKSIYSKLYDQISDKDIRKQAYNSPTKPQYKSLPAYANVKFRDTGGWTADYVYMRTAEMYLAAAEGNAKNGKEGEAIKLLSTLLKQRNVDTDYLSSLSGKALQDEIYLQRRIELWGEGVSLIDLKRLKVPIIRDASSNHRSDAILEIPVADNLLIYQIPQAELDANREINENDQNP